MRKFLILVPLALLAACSSDIRYTACDAALTGKADPTGDLHAQCRKDTFGAAHLAAYDAAKKYRDMPRF
jgi:hypothetical protein